MEPLTIGGTKDSPGINFDKQLGKFLIFGKSFPEEARKFFDPALIWLEEYIQEPNEETIVEFRLEYFNSATSTMLLEMLYVFEKIIKEKSKKVKVIWNYLEVDEDMLDSGTEYSEMVKIPFEFKIIEDY